MPTPTDEPTTAAAARATTDGGDAAGDADRHGVVRLLLRGLDFTVLGLVAVVGVASVAFLDAAMQALLLKLFVIVFLSLLPGWLYLQFVVIKGDGLYDEYVLNLYRLEIDSVANLPMPPPASDHWDAWRAAYERHPEADPAENVYLRRFEAVYGRSAVPDRRRRVPTPGDTGRAGGPHRPRRSSDTFAPVVWATALLCAGWLAVLQPEAYRVLDLFEDVSLSGLPEVPAEPLRFGFIGAYAFLLQTAVRRYFQSDLKTHFYVGAITRVVIVSLVVVAVAQVWQGTSNLQNAFAFLLGFFPLLGLHLIQQALAGVLGGLVPAMRERHPLTDLDGLNIWWQARLVEEGVEDMQHLTTADLVELMLHTRVPVNRMVDWIDQAFLYLRLEPAPPGAAGGAAPVDARSRLRAHGIRTATDLLDAVDDADATDDPAFVEGLGSLLRQDGSPLDPLAGLRRGLAGEVNLWHVRRWKAAAWLRGQPRPDDTSTPNAPTPTTPAASVPAPAPAPTPVAATPTPTA